MSIETLINLLVGGLFPLNGLDKSYVTWFEGNNCLSVSHMPHVITMISRCDGRLENRCTLFDISGIIMVCRIGSVTSVLWLEWNVLISSSFDLFGQNGYSTFCSPTFVHNDETAYNWWNYKIILYSFLCLKQNKV